MARAQSYVTYGILMPLLGLRHPITPDRHKLEGWLGHISECEHQQRRPLLSVLVESRDDCACRVRVFHARSSTVITTIFMPRRLSAE